jgi:CheY-like chemotaxis protein
MKILVIEDSRFLRLALERTLVKAGYQVTAIGDGEGGLRLAQEMAPDAIVLDMMLPTLEGTAVLRLLKQDPTTRPIPVIILSGLSHKNEEKLKLAGAEAFLQKSELDLEGAPRALLTLMQQLFTKLERNDEGHSKSFATGTVS